MAAKRIVTAPKAPQAIGPYSVAASFGDLVFTAGQLGLDPLTGNIVSGGVEVETRQALNNLKNILESAGSSLGNVLKTTIFLRNMMDFGEVNAVYAEFFTADFPARSTVTVAALPKNGLVEIEAVACLGN
ncbi:MAG: reactive intermediate/imine deaminase [Chloroflexi bacterium RBG_16_54_18]|nr:MAG: reactive intermediate/imine deaminase [Chloroflexi bacterium RBG_16_54_18]